MLTFGARGYFPAPKPKNCVLSHRGLSRSRPLAHNQNSCPGCKRCEELAPKDLNLAEVVHPAQAVLNVNEVLRSAVQAHEPDPA